MNPRLISLAALGALSLVGCANETPPVRTRTVSVTPSALATGQNTVFVRLHEKTVTDGDVTERDIVTPVLVMNDGASAGCYAGRAPGGDSAVKRRTDVFTECKAATGFALEVSVRRVDDKTAFVKVAPFVYRALPGEEAFVVNWDGRVPLGQESVIIPAR